MESDDKGARGSGIATASAWSSLALNLGLVAGVMVLSPLAYPTEWWTSDLDAPVLLAFAAVGALVASRRRDNTIGWLFCAGATIWASGSLGHQYAQGGLAHPTSVWPSGSLGHQYAQGGLAHPTSVWPWTAEAALAARCLTGLGWACSLPSPSCYFLTGGCLPCVGVRLLGWRRA